MSIGERLREERERIDLNQEQLGAIGGVKKLAQFNYENNKRAPDTDYLVQIAKIGIDVNYVLFGTRANNALTDEEQQLLAAFRAAPPAMRQFMLGGAGNLGKNKITIHGNVGQQNYFETAVGDFMYKKGK